MTHSVVLNCEIVGMRDRLDLGSSVPSYDTFNFGFGNEPFVENGCEWTNCFATKDRTALPVDEFDAIIIHIRYMVTILSCDWSGSGGAHHGGV